MAGSDVDDFRESMEESALPDTPVGTIESVREAISHAKKTHIRHLYSNRRDLIEILVPFFKEGLEAGEFCFWGCDVPLPPEQALAELRQEVPDVDHFIETKQ